MKEEREEWMKMAYDSFASAEKLFEEGLLRSSASRAYYSMYQAAQAILVRAGVQPPKRGNWGHRATVECLDGNAKTHLQRYGFRSLPMRQRLARAFDLRCDADYNRSARFDGPTIRDALRYAGQFLRSAKEVTEHAR